MDGLAEFILARLDEDEAAARSLAMATRFVEGCPDFYGRGGPAAEVYWERFPPDRVLRDAEATRKVLAAFTNAQGQILDGTMIHLGGGYTMRGGWVVRQLAAVYSDHPDYRAEWKP